MMSSSRRKDGRKISNVSPFSHTVKFGKRYNNNNNTQTLCTGTCILCTVMLCGIYDEKNVFARRATGAVRAYRPYNWKDVCRGVSLTAACVRLKNVENNNSNNKKYLPVSSGKYTVEAWSLFPDDTTLSRSSSWLAVFFFFFTFFRAAPHCTTVHNNMIL